VQLQLILVMLRHTDQIPLCSLFIYLLIYFVVYLLRGISCSTVWNDTVISEKCIGKVVKERKKDIALYLNFLEKIWKRKDTYLSGRRC